MKNAAEKLIDRHLNEQRVDESPEGAESILKARGLVEKAQDIVHKCIRDSGLMDKKAMLIGQKLEDAFRLMSQY
jgi:hypothetical protein